MVNSDGLVADTTKEYMRTMSKKITEKCIGLTEVFIEDNGTVVFKTD